MPEKTAVEACLRALEHRVSGTVRTDAYSRMLYSTDASIYQVNPIAVLVPEHREDVHAAVEAASEFGVPLLPRASGSSLAGQAVGEAIIVDFTRFLDKICEVDVDARTARVEPGVVLGTLNKSLAVHGLQFGPDPASANRAAVGGCVANNSTGAHSIIYGMTADHVIETNVILSDGSRAHFGPLSDAELARRSAFDAREGAILKGIKDLTTTPENVRVIQDHTPRHWRRCGGYNLDRLIPEGATFRVPQDPRFNLAQLICGSEGTLAIMEDVTLKLVPVPAVTGLAIVHFNDLHAALATVSSILETNPSAVELLDHLGMSLCRQVPAWRRKLEGFVTGDPECVLITEYDGESESEVKSKMERLKVLLSGPAKGVTSIVHVLSDEGQADVWSVRKMGLGFLMSIPGDHKPIPFIEDAAVPLEHLPEYVTGIERFCGGLDTKVAYYAHASAGCVHIRPLINTKSATEIAKLPEIMAFAIEKLHGFGGALSSEHGDGRARSAFNEQFFGPDLYALYRSVKHVFDPANLFNPGNIVDAGPMTENLRFGAAYGTVPVDTHLDFSEDGGFDRVIEMCNGAGVCRKLDQATMCPSFMATREEEHSTRGRANALRAVLSGRIDSNGLGDKRLYQTMDLCLECKACASECPSSVDMAKLKMEFLAQYQDKHGVPLRSRIFGRVAQAARRNSGTRASVINSILKRRGVRRILEQSIGITRHRALPAFAVQPFTRWFETHEAGRGDRGPVVLFNDTFNTYNYPNVSIAATRLLEAMGFEVQLSNHGCCGRPMLSKGMIDEARLVADQTLNALLPSAEKGIPIVGLEPSCFLSFGDEYRSLFPGDSRVGIVANQVSSLEEFMGRSDGVEPLSTIFSEQQKHILYHGHCHLKSLSGTAATVSALRLPPGFSVEEIDSGCCGMAGSFGFEKEHYKLSMQIGEDRLFPAVRQSGNDSLICASGVSCRQQIEHGTGRTVRHPAELLWEAVSATS